VIADKGGALSLSPHVVSHFVHLFHYFVNNISITVLSRNSVCTQIAVTDVQGDSKKYPNTKMRKIFGPNFPHVFRTKLRFSVCRKMKGTQTFSTEQKVGFIRVIRAVTITIVGTSL